MKPYINFCGEANIPRGFTKKAKGPLDAKLRTTIKLKRTAFSTSHASGTEWKKVPVFVRRGRE